MLYTRQYVEFKKGSRKKKKEFIKKGVPIHSSNRSDYLIPGLSLFVNTTTDEAK
jgi:hypothetical protein